MTRSTNDTPSLQRLKYANPGDILLFYRARGINRIIPWFSGSPFYHVGIYAGGVHVVESRPTGVLRRDLRIPGSGRHFLIIPAPGDKGSEALAWAEQKVGDGYAPLSVMALIVDRLSRRLRPNIPQPERFSCGEFVTKAFAHAGLRLFPERPAELVAPWDFECLLPRGLRVRRRGILCLNPRRHITAARPSFR